MIEKALAELSSQGAQSQHKGKNRPQPTWPGVVATKSAKSQALHAMSALIAHQPIAVMRARMRLRITCPNNILKQAAKPAPNPKADSNEHDTAEGLTKGTVKDLILSHVEQVEQQDVMGEEWEVVGFVEPGAFKGLGEFVGSETKGRGRIEVLDMAVMHEDEYDYHYDYT